ncbi:MAG TPA: hypothetical protein VEL76_28205 [Gemmataceae bacterium]|nr:hypothetical protein [Gemmataceae bacterium]
MWLNDLYEHWRGRSAKAQRSRSPAPRCRGPRLTLERLEDRTVPASFTAASVAELVADINAANLLGGANTITLAPGTTFTMTAADNATDGGNGLPVVAAGDDLTIQGNGDVIERSAAAGTPAFRLFDVAAGASLTLSDLILQGGLTYSGGGAVYNQGALTLDGVIVQHNFGGYAGGGIWSNGSLNMEGNTIVQNNQARGVDGFAYFDFFSGTLLTLPAGSASGGGLYVAGGTALLTDVTLSGNTAQGGRGADAATFYDLFSGLTIRVSAGNGGSGYGGGLHAVGGTLELHNTSVTGNSALGGAGGLGGLKEKDGRAGPGLGGGLYLDAAAGCLDAFTKDHVKDNFASSHDANIHGQWKRC